MLASDIIQQLMEAFGAPGLHFPHLCVFYPVDARLSAYRSDAHWALVLEMLVFNDGPSGHECCATMLFCYGKDLPQSIGRSGSLHVTGDGPSGPLFDPIDILGHFISPSASDMTIRRRVVAITTNPLEFATAGIQLKWLPRIHGVELLRLLVPCHRRLFFATEAEIIERIGEPMPLLLRLDEWRHPDRERGETPADSETFQMIAEAIAHNDPLLYQPTLPPNTHWSNYPIAGVV